MFYSDKLLAKTGPLARVWLMANLERKVNKSHILSSDIESSVDAIKDDSQVPMALRLSGQLLLGVVRIYSRKTRYLMDDCNEALLKLKLAFRPGNLDLDLAAIPSTNPNPNLVVPDHLAVPELFPVLDPSVLDFNDMSLNFGLGNSKNALNWNNSQLLTSDEPSIEIGRRAPAQEEPSRLYDDDLELNLDFDDDSAQPVEKARADPPAQLYEDDLGLNFGDDNETNLPRDATAEPLNLGDDGMMVDLNEAEDVPQLTFESSPHPDDDGSPLSSTRTTPQLEASYQFEEANDDDVPRQTAAKKRRALPLDSETMIPNDQIKRQQTHHENILREAALLPSDPYLLALTQMQANGSFVNDVLGNGRSRFWAPELQGVLSLESVRKAGSLKRKRDERASTAADIEPHINIPEDDDMYNDDAGLAPPMDDTMIHLDEEPLPLATAQIDPVYRSSEEALTPPPVQDSTFDVTTAPLLHPNEQGPISLGTRHAVHLLREHFSDSDGGEPSNLTQKKSSILFNELLPETTTSKSDATKMFFEVLVLATKDAIKVEQGAQLGADIRIRAKRGLWGAWAEKEAGGEISQSQQAQTQEVEVEV